ncbi:hypothetical protein SAMN05660337_2355 [Maridesulfovibrio ferrireducens]|uniref:Uncharacterized protein n=1 Tax=Maridesulfovibrio ferrireducens TaxID=246191 RepID=A0A1G9HXB6_9BACT|nr:hypothetical protein [Maridesulfovibrio ferrireducens]SDL17589.1 hypothetical protein SAMN05660337_2355 [Maridesulfovibrio ferrireducens]
MKKVFTLFVFALAISCLSLSAFAESEMAVPDVKSKPVPVSDKAENLNKKDGFAIIVEHFGNDEVGGTLALKLKENFRKSVLFRLADKKQKSVRIKVVSSSEFSERPEIGSIYAVIWTFAASEDVVPFYLDKRIGTVNVLNVETTAAKLMNTTDKIATQYKFLFE